jgi:hypothetical protein
VWPKRARLAIGNTAGTGYALVTTPRRRERGCAREASRRVGRRRDPRRAASGGWRGRGGGERWRVGSGRVIASHAVVWRESARARRAESRAR